MFGLNVKKQTAATKQQVFRALVDAGEGRTMLDTVEQEECCEFVVFLEIPESEAQREEMGKGLTSSRLREVFATIKPGAYVVAENLNGQVSVSLCENRSAYNIASRLV